jgi:Zn-dependent peptidase ImmA (M78 family)
LTRQSWDDAVPELIERCRNAGAAVVLVPYLSKTGLRGAAFWATKDKAVILLSDFNKAEASVWFAFFHEAAHVLLHSKKTIFVDREKDGSGGAEVEKEADAFSAEFLVPSDSLNYVMSQCPSRLTAAWLESAAEQIGIGTDLLLGRLQHDQYLKPSSTFNKDFRRKLQFEKCTPFI